MSQIRLKQASGSLTPCVGRSVLQLAALPPRSLSLQRPRRLISRAPDLPLLALGWRTMAPFLCPGALCSGSSALPLSSHDVVPLLWAAAFACAVSSREVERLWQTQRPSPSRAADDSENSRSQTRGSCTLNCVSFTLLSLKREWLNISWNKTLFRIFLLPSVMCMCRLFLSCTSPSVNPLSQNYTPSVCAFATLGRSRRRASICTAFIKWCGSDVRVYTHSRVHSH